jgi:hypothetical protein
VNKLYQQLTSFFLLLCILSVIIPVNIFHNHEQHTHCDKTDVTSESNPCHISVYHDELKEQHCEHKTHFDTESEACEFCKFLTPRQFHFTVFNNYQYKIITELISNDFVSEYNTTLPQYLLSSILYRGPPLC